ncbi:MAG: Sjogren's syndrome/scleroderma autoantigen 1 family protein [Desulfurococcaceae archaeon]
MDVKADPVKIMAELLKSGATMLAETCPVERCNLPLFKLKSGEVVCPVHGKVHVVKTEEEVREVYSREYMAYVVGRIEQYALKSVETLLNAPDADPTDLIKWLEVLERVQRLKATTKK